MYFLTYNDAPDGIYMSQVIDVCRFWEDTFKERVTLISIISLRDFFVNKQKIKRAYPDSIVIPMFPGIENWRMNSIRLKTALLFRKKGNVISRGVFATLLALDSKNKFNKVCFDARGAYAAEWEEYLKGYSPTLTSKMKDLEKDALLKSDYRIAVSQKLVDYWKEMYGYAETTHVVIPCTLDSTLQINYNKEQALQIRNSLNVASNDILLVYSGSSAQWQSFAKLEEYIATAFEQNPRINLLMLCKPGAEKQLTLKYPERVMQAWVRPEEVPIYLSAADYGLLVREPSVTNKVSSPVKFAEYLAAGLPVILSNGVGDYSAFVQEKKCGNIVETVNWAELKPNTESEKLRIQEIAKTYFSKTAYADSYRKIRSC